MTNNNKGGDKLELNGFQTLEDFLQERSEQIGKIVTSIALPLTVGIYGQTLLTGVASLPKSLRELQAKIEEIRELINPTIPRGFIQKIQKEQGQSPKEI